MIAARTPRGNRFAVVYIVMAYIVMAYVVMACGNRFAVVYIVMAYIVMDTSAVTDSPQSTAAHVVGQSRFLLLREGI